MTVACASSMVVMPVAQACTRFVYHGADDLIVTARSMDWRLDVETNLWVFPRGMKRNGEAGENSLQWTAKYGSVVATGYDISTTDGLNEAGLSASVLWLVESSYPEPSDKPGLTIAAWAQYVLDNFATVSEAVETLRTEPFTLVTSYVPGEDRLATLHLAISDATGDSAIVEYIDGQQIIHHGSQYQVVTNSPTYRKQLAMNQYWQEAGGTMVLPGTNRSPDRFARAYFYANAVPKTPDLLKSIASVFSVIRNVSVPFGISTPDQPNIASTRWRTVADQKHLRYFFESALTPNIFWVDLKELDFSQETGQTLKLALGPNQSRTLAGEVHSYFQPAQPFQFLGL
ncbi:linear amide C-N hydrolase [Mesopusillimonas faecipullorum]|nr:linear amide C-N hydrolase [Mesopusillimonas faecipullorum]